MLAMNNIIIANRSTAFYYPIICVRPCRCTVPVLAIIIEITKAIFKTSINHEFIVTMVSIVSNDSIHEPIFLHFGLFIFKIASAKSDFKIVFKNNWLCFIRKNNSS